MISSASATLLRSAFEAAIAAVDPWRCLPPFLPAPPSGRTLVIGAGKAAASMARAVEEHWPGDLSGLVVTRYGHGAPTSRIKVIEAGHPVPDAAGLAAAKQIKDSVSDLGPDDLVLCLISGGGSALLALPAPGILLEDKQAIGNVLLKSGASIHEINCVRKHLSAIKGGRLALATAPARVVTLIISDVPGNDPSVIASGPSVPDPTTTADALAVLKKNRIAVSSAVNEFLHGPEAETPKPGAACFEKNEVHVIATSQDALAAAADVARKHGVNPVILGYAVEGEARDVALVQAEIARQIADRGEPARSPCLLLSGGETTVTVRGAGRGGRNTEFLLALAIALEGNPDVHAIACDTDGIDGTENNAGALIAPDTLARARALGLDAATELAANNAFSFFEALDDLVMTGPTLTNVSDFRAVLHHRVR
ncbi:MAG: glycerate kinase [Verrucomicrobia bacterium]|nr:MAG: glycerate kinase [Verrucomicrobiota bacterium]